MALKGSLLLWAACACLLIVSVNGHRGHHRNGRHRGDHHRKLAHPSKEHIGHFGWHDPVKYAERLQGASAVRSNNRLEDAKAYAGRYFEYPVPMDAFSDPNCELKVTADGGNLPPWLHYDPIQRMLRGVPLPTDAGSYVITVTALSRVTGQKAAADIFRLYVGLRSPETVAKHHQHRNGKRPDGGILTSRHSHDHIATPLPPTTCKHREPITAVTVLLDADVTNMTSEARVVLLERARDSLGLVIDHLHLKKSTEAFDSSSALVAGLGDTEETTASRRGRSVLVWTVGCGSVSPHHIQLIGDVEASAKDGRLRAGLGQGVIGWHVTNREPDTIVHQRAKRGIFATPTLDPSQPSRAGGGMPLDPAVGDGGYIIDTPLPLITPSEALHVPTSTYVVVVTEELVRPTATSDLMSSSAVHRVTAPPPTQPPPPPPLPSTTTTTPTTTTTTTAPTPASTPRITPSPSLPPPTTPPPSLPPPTTPPPPPPLPQNTPPQPGEPLAPLSIVAGEQVKYTFPANAFVDTDKGDALSYDLLTESGEVGLPSWVLAADDRHAIFSPEKTEEGKHTFLYRATDKYGDTATQEFVVNVGTLSEADVLQKVTVVLDLDYNEIMKRPDGKQMVLDMLQELYPGARIVITDIQPGSIVVDFTIAADPEATDKTLTCEEIGGANSKLFDSEGNLLPGVDPAVTEVTFEVGSDCEGVVPTRTPVNEPPVAKGPAIELNLPMNHAFEYILPMDIFHDDHDTWETLTVQLYSNQALVTNAHWIHLDTRSASERALIGFPSPNHVEEGTSLFHLRATDSSGAEASLSVTVRVTQPDGVYSYFGETRLVHWTGSRLEFVHALSAALGSATSENLQPANLREIGLESWKQEAGDHLIVRWHLEADRNTCVSPARLRLLFEAAASHAKGERLWTLRDEWNEEFYSMQRSARVWNARVVGEPARMAGCIATPKVIHSVRGPQPVATPPHLSITQYRLIDWKLPEDLFVAWGDDDSQISLSEMDDVRIHMTNLEVQDDDLWIKGVSTNKLSSNVARPSLSISATQEGLHSFAHVNVTVTPLILQPSHHAEIMLDGPFRTVSTLDKHAILIKLAEATQSDLGAMAMYSSRIGLDRDGSYIATWAVVDDATSLDPADGGTCSNAGGLQRVHTALFDDQLTVRKAVQDALKPYRIKDMAFQPVDECAGKVKAVPLTMDVKSAGGEIGGGEGGEPFDVTVIVIILVVVLLLLAVAIIVTIICLRRRRGRANVSRSGRHSSRGNGIPSNTYIEKGVPVIFEEELKEKNGHRSLSGNGRANDSVSEFSASQPLLGDRRQPSSGAAAGAPPPPEYPTNGSSDGSEEPLMGRGDQRSSDDSGDGSPPYQPPTPPMSEPDEGRELLIRDTANNGSAFIERRPVPP